MMIQPCIERPAMESSSSPSHHFLTRIVLKIEEIIDSMGITTEMKLRNAAREGRFETVAIIRQMQGRKL